MREVSQTQRGDPDTVWTDLTLKGKGTPKDKLIQASGRPSMLRDRENRLESQDWVNSREPLILDHSTGLQLLG